MAVPTVFLNGEPFGQGRMEPGADRRQDRHQRLPRAPPRRSRPTDAFDVLVVGGGPAGAAAAIYAARKGIRTGVAAERFGGQVLDTMAIENFISVPHTEGPKLAAHLEQHVKDYDVDIMNLQRAEKLIPARTPGGLHEVRLENGASLKARTVILSTGARWRQMNVPGEDQYRNKGVAYCPHCDGPLFKGKRVAVIGGGNSGVEAAIDLAGIVAHVTLIEFDSDLRADAVLQRKLASLPNVKIITSALTTEVQGDGEKVTGLTYKDRNRDTVHQIELEGIFVQIGLVPNTRVAARHGGARQSRRDRGGSSRRDEPARHLRRRRLHDRALQADRHRHGRGARRRRSPRSTISSACPPATRRSPPDPSPAGRHAPFVAAGPCGRYRSPLPFPLGDRSIGAAAWSLHP